MNLDIDIEESKDHRKAEIICRGEIYRVIEPIAKGPEAFLRSLASKIQTISYPEIDKGQASSFTTYYRMDRFQGGLDADPIFRFRCDCGHVSDTFPKRTTNPSDWPEFQNFRNHECKK